MHSEKTRIPKQKRSIARKKLIKKTALGLFSEKGYANVSTNEIAKEANISIGSLYRYFPNKKEIYNELVDDLYSDVLFNSVPEGSYVFIVSKRRFSPIGKSIPYICNK